MNILRVMLKEHRHFVIVVTLLTLVITFPTIVYVFKTGEFWHPAGSDPDTFIKFWDIWYGMRIVTGQADRFYTDLMFYPEGVSLVNHPFFWPQVIVVNTLQLIMPLSNAYNLSFLLIVFSSALAAYTYLLWLFKDKWIAQFGAVVFGFCPHVLGFASWPETAWLAVFPLNLYIFHRAVVERRAGLFFLAGILAGLTSVVTLYHYVQVVIMLGFTVCAFAVSRWRDDIFWRHVILLIVALGLSSAWRVIPMMQHRAALDEAMTYYSQGETHYDLITNFSHHRHPVLGPLAKELLKTPQNAQPNTSYSYLGLLPLVLVGIGLYRSGTRRKMLPWLGLCLVFLVLRLGSTLQINGTEFVGILLPKHYLNQLLPFAFEPFAVTARFMAGARLPMAILSCFGVIALRDRYPVAARPRFILALILIVAFEYYIPVEMTSLDPITNQPFTDERLAFLDWLEEEDAEVRLINLPFGRDNAKLYNFYQLLSGFPQTEGAISRTPDSAYDYIRANPVLSIWHEHRPTNCVIQLRDHYLEGLTQLAEDGFSHVVHHHGFYFWARHIENFRYVDPAYSDNYVSIYRLNDLRESCPSKANHD